MSEKSGSASLKSDLRITEEKRHYLTALPKIPFLTNNFSPASRDRLDKLLFAEEVHGSSPEKRTYQGKETGHS
jgi:hypothetical protein